MRIPCSPAASFTDRDDAQSPQVVLVNQSLVRRFWPNEIPLGKRVWIGNLPNPYQDGGIIGDTRNGGTGLAPEVLIPSAMGGRICR